MELGKPVRVLVIERLESPPELGPEPSPPGVINIPKPEEELIAHE